MRQLKLISLQLLMRMLLRLHHATFSWLRWCEDRLEDYQELDDMVDEILNKEPKPRRPLPPILGSRVTRPTLH